jgi:hypothetical protein
MTDFSEKRDSRIFTRAIDISAKRIKNHLLHVVLHQCYKSVKSVGPVAATASLFLK